jgi:hypothetical protein
LPGDVTAGGSDGALSTTTDRRGAGVLDFLSTAGSNPSTDCTGKASHDTSAVITPMKAVKN